MAALLTACSGCNHSAVPYRYIAAHESATPRAQKVIPVWVDRNFGQADRLAIDDAIGQWNYALNGYVVLAPAWGFEVGSETATEGIELIRVNSKEDPLPDNEGVVAWTHRPDQARTPTTISFIRERLDNEYMEPTVLHELGHALGAKHTPGGIMAPVGFDEPFCLDRSVIEQVADKFHLPMNNLSWCDYGEPVPTPSDPSEP